MDEEKSFTQEIIEIKQKLDQVSDARTVAEWNRLREEFKADYSQRAINWLDGSALINNWIHGLKLSQS